MTSKHSWFGKGQGLAVDFSPRGQVTVVGVASWWRWVAVQLSAGLQLTPTGKTPAGNQRAAAAAGA